MAPSDAELPEAFRISIAPLRAACDGILECPARLAAACVDEGIAIDTNNLETHVIGAVEGDDGFLAEGCGQMPLEHTGFPSAEEQERRGLSVIALGADQIGNGHRIPIASHRQLRCDRCDVRQWCVLLFGVHIRVLISSFPMRHPGRIPGCHMRQKYGGLTRRLSLPVAEITEDQTT
jgi:hypothetical protein